MSGHMRSANRTVPSGLMPPGGRTITPSAANRGSTDCAQMLADFVEAQTAGFSLGVPARRAQRAEVVVAIDDARRDRNRRAARVGGADQRVQRERRRAVAARELVDERANA